jgi:tetrahydrodipicolinate N-succinyltransferase
MDAVDEVIAQLNTGKMRVATRQGVGQWTVHQWIKKAVLLSFRLKDNEAGARRVTWVLRQGAHQVCPPDSRR